jgi:hypothetical protein
MGGTKSYRFTLRFGEPRHTAALILCLGELIIRNIR